MIILSDNNRVTYDNFGEDYSLVEYSKSLPISVNNVKKRILNTTNPQIISKNTNNFWEFLFLTEYTRESQFDIVNGLISQNIEVPKNFICLAESGNKFHGFRNRPWKTEKGNIHLTLYFKPKKTVENFHAGLLIVAAAAALKTIDSIPNLKGTAKTKWVNDITINGSKVCGIITQSFSTGSEISGAVIGIGLNVLVKPQIPQDIFTTKITSILEESDENSFTLPFVLNSLLENLATSISELENGLYKSLLDFYIERSAVIGKDISIFSDPIHGEIKKIVSGKVLGINNRLELVIENYKDTIKSGRLAFN
jgi:BirA family biotin operon repressor/biotin-[acetyl-CoA-carboxylase] ligase